MMSPPLVTTIPTSVLSSNSPSTFFDKPITWWRKNVVEPRRTPQPWYHRNFTRVPTIDECYVDDVVCREEAHQQFKRDWMVEQEIVHLLRARVEDCAFYEKGSGIANWGQVNPIDLSEGSKHPCKGILDTYERAAENYFIKYGEMAHYARVEDAFMKQKHRLMWERRHGPVGTGMKESTAE